MRLIHLSNSFFSLIIQTLFATFVSIQKLTGKRTDIISQVDFHKRP